MSFTNEHLTRQLDIIPTHILGEPITIIGAGAIGGWTTLALAKMGFTNITVWDHDVVDTVNMNSQFYRLADIGKAKAVALQNLVQDFTGTKVLIWPGRYEKGAFPGIVISAVDSMTVRKLIWDNHQRSYGTRAIIDPRMGAEQALLYVMKPTAEDDREAYPKTLYSDTEAEQERCTAKATIYTANLLSGLVVKAVKDLLTTPNYLRTAQWNILKNDVMLFSKEG
jgi:molybdopterin/thiamine biosynthesis adenylyltransferase